MTLQAVLDDIRKRPGSGEVIAVIDPATEEQITEFTDCGEEAVDVIQSTRIDIALLDMHMPRRTGLETLRVLKEVRLEAPGILVTAGATDALRREAVAARAYQVLDKPVGKSMLMTTVDAALRSAYREFSGLA